MTFDMALNLPTLITIFGSVIGGVIWLVRLEGRVNTNSSITTALSERLTAVHALASLSQNQLAEYKTHVAEKYVTKEGLSEQHDRLMTAVNDVRSSVEQIGSRIDHFYTNPPQRPSSRSTRT